MDKQDLNELQVNREAELENALSDLLECFEPTSSTNRPELADAYGHYISVNDETAEAIRRAQQVLDDGEELPYEFFND